MDIILDNWFLRKLFLLRKIYLSRTSMRHYSQYGEDDSTYQHLASIHRGFFVDVGCFHPVKYSNTYRWYRKGWRGVDAEGYDLSVLESLSFEKYSPFLILVELHQHTIEKVMESDLYKFLVGKSYDLVNWTGPTLVFKRKAA